MSRAASLIAKTNRLLSSTTPFDRTVYLRFTTLSGGDPLLGRYGSVSITDTLLSPQPFVHRLGRDRIPGGHAMAETLNVGSKVKIGDDYMLLGSASMLTVAQLQDPGNMLLFVDQSGNLETLVVHDYEDATVDGTNVAFTVYCRSVESSIDSSLSGVTTYTTYFTPTPAFDMGLASTFVMTLTGNVASSSVKNAKQGLCTITVQQDSVGGRSFAFPPNFLGAGVISSAAGTAAPNSFATQTFAPTPSEGTFVAVGPLSYGGA